MCFIPVAVDLCLKTGDGLMGGEPFLGCMDFCVLPAVDFKMTNGPGYIHTYYVHTHTCILSHVTAYFSVLLYLYIHAYLMHGIHTHFWVTTGLVCKRTGSHRHSTLRQMEMYRFANVNKHNRQKDSYCASCPWQFAFFTTQHTLAPAASSPLRPNDFRILS